MRTTRMKRAFGAATLTLALTATAACGGSTGDTASSDSSSDHNAADVSFAQDMLVHHAQAIEMVDLTEGRQLDPKVEKLAAEIKDAQAPEIETFTGWLNDWDETVPDGSMSDMEDMEGMEGMDHDMPGMMSDADMQFLEAAPDEFFQDEWLDMMIEHHKGAIEMAEAQIEDGQYQPAVELAEQIATSQDAEVTTMRKLLAH